MICSTERDSEEALAHFTIHECEIRNVDKSVTTAMATPPKKNYYCKRSENGFH